jgi:ABC-2 type transport system ATP-binding protein
MVKTPILELINLSFTYRRKGELILDNINLTVFPGERVGIIGGNGSGKSTISKLILGIHTPAEGKVKLFGHTVSWNTHFPRLGYIGDPGYNAEELGLPTDLKVGEILKLVRDLEKFGGVKEMLDVSTKLLGLDNLKQRSIRNLSTGERKRLMAGITFLRNPEFIVMDEPLDGLDEDVVNYIKELITRTMVNNNTTLFYIGHDIVEIDTFTDKVFRLHEGKLLEEKQRHFQGTLRLDGTTKPFEKKTGEVIGCLIDVMKSPISADGLQLHLNPSNP